MKWWPWRRRQSCAVEIYPRRLADGNEVPLPGYRTYREILNAPTRTLPNVEPGTPIVRPYVNVMLLASVVLALLAGCYPDTNSPSDTGGTGQTVSCSIFRPSAPYRIKGPTSDGPNAYTFTSRGRRSFVQQASGAGQCHRRFPLRNQRNGWRDSGAYDSVPEQTGMRGIRGLPTSTTCLPHRLPLYRLRSGHRMVRCYPNIRASHNSKPRKPAQTR